MSDISDFVAGLFAIMAFIVITAAVIAIYFGPSIIAFKRQHHYRWVILAINTVGGITIIGYLAAFVWSVWPRETAFADPFYGDPTSSNVESGRKVYARRGEYQNATAAGEQWYFSEGTAIQGPVSRSDLIQKVLGGDIARTALVWREGMAGWIAIEQAIPLPANAS